MPRVFNSIVLTVVFAVPFLNFVIFSHSLSLDFHSLLWSAVVVYPRRWLSTLLENEHRKPLGNLVDHWGVDQYD